MNPAPSGRHGDVESQLHVVLRPLAQRAGLRMRGQFNLGQDGDYRVPDGGLQQDATDRVYYATAALVIEIVSPGDESRGKVAFYAARGVEERADRVLGAPDSRLPSRSSPGIRRKLARSPIPSAESENCLMASTPVVSRVTVPDDIARSVILSLAYGDIERVVYPACAWLRENQPVAMAEVEGYDPTWLISRHADIQAVLRDANTFHSADINPMFHPIAGDEFTKRINNGTTRVLDFPTYMDPPEHAVYRSATANAFQPAVVRKWAERFRQIAVEHVDHFVSLGGEADFVKDLSSRYPLHTIMEMLGVPIEDYDLMLKLTQDTFGGEDPDWNRSDIPLTPDAAAKQWQAAVLDFERYFASMLEDRKAHPTDDLITTIVTARLENGEPMPPKIQNHYVSGLAAAGHDTTNSALSGGILGLARFPDQLALIRENPKLVGGLVDESLRYATPAKHFMRNATRDTEVAGVPVNGNGQAHVPVRLGQSRRDGVPRR
jgi:cytochrome P450